MSDYDYTLISDDTMFSTDETDATVLSEMNARADMLS